MSTGLAAGGVNDGPFTGLPYLLPGLIMFILVICVDVLVMVLFFREIGPVPAPGHRPTVSKRRCAPVA